MMGCRTKEPTQIDKNATISYARLVGANLMELDYEEFSDSNDEEFRDD